MNKNCNKCKRDKPITDYCKHPETRDKLSNICRECKNEKQRYDRSRTGNAYTMRYEKTQTGFIMRTYRNMKSRVLGMCPKGRLLYTNLPILEKETFYQWAQGNIEFNRLFQEWVDSGYNRKQTPSIDRINPGEGYILGNIRWLTHSENSRLGCISRYSKSA